MRALKNQLEGTSPSSPAPFFVCHDLHGAEVVALVASPQLTVGVRAPGVQQPLIR